MILASSYTEFGYDASHNEGFRKALMDLARFCEQGMDVNIIPRRPGETEIFWEFKGEGYTWEEMSRSR